MMHINVLIRKTDILVALPEATRGSYSNHTCKRIERTC